tara:strand:- start:1519 stop:1716 length:198 start_codon:yes stop_codon:yes gene_type:complete
MKQLLALLLLLCLIHPVAYGETIDYDSGDRYVGETLNDVPDGYGTYTWTDGAKYVLTFILFVGEK